MKKLIYLVGVYSICAFVHDGINYAWEPIDILLKEKFQNRQTKRKRGDVKTVYKGSSFSVRRCPKTIIFCYQQKKQGP